MKLQEASSTLTLGDKAANGTAASERKGDSFPDGWKGGFKDTTEADLSDLEITGNRDNIEKITRTQKILWPEFSWLSIPGDETSRVYEMFAKDVSRIGYDNDGRIWSLICPQRALFLPPFGTVMIEVTVLGVKGWVDEPNKDMFANIGIRGNIWIESENDLVNEFKAAFEKVGKKFPLSKEHAIKINAHAVGKPDEEFWPVKKGLDPNFDHPSFTKHWDEAFQVYNLEVEMGKPQLAHDELVDDFNKMFLALFNNMSGNLVTEGQRVAWHVWAGKPELVDTAEWKGHAKKWYESLTVKHEYPSGDPGVARDADGNEFKPQLNLAENLQIVWEFIRDHSDTIELALGERLEHSRVKFLRDLFERSTSHVIEAPIVEETSSDEKTSSDEEPSQIEEPSPKRVKID
mmetsp:Transcript_15004/g.34782  ORF Transcript_15004/g.34782 Transcript_15004/m.34782 type:complete len:403 (-) Transcript_15004:499-1707(-)|eukprot:CAMPEP_0197178912 /NCGR_PEP_ID=MMETSP1423-20130617/4032_1 /TAXON_ID=476441 /ORGANISM="Pseudo-nitzschia heimii, Strain UNC1101" /LENGTH=402 /DNA_ID=CAMNT_0042628731 /DNA_START=75 /DNA_END=1283 /DNA_ORIENTATION=+